MGYVAQIIDINATPSASLLFGSYGGKAIVEDLNAKWGGSVIFGQAGDAFAERHAKFRHFVVEERDEACRQIAITNNLLGINEYIEIHDVETLSIMPQCMQPFVLTDPRIRPHFEEGVIDGWGIEPEYLVEEDVAGRLINNGRVCDESDDESMSWTFRDDDPEFTMRELALIEQARDYTANFLARELMPDAEGIDPTAITTGGMIGKIK